MIEADIKFVVGKSGSGKSFLIHKMIEDEKRLIVYDGKCSKDYLDTGIVIKDIPTFKKVFLNCYQKNFRIVYHPIDESEYEQIAKLVYLCGNLMLVGEECDEYYTTHGTKFFSKAILKRGRSEDIRTILATQRPYDISRNITAMATEAFIFETHEPRDVAYLKDRFGDNLEEHLLKLQQYEYVRCWNGKENKEIKKERFGSL